MAIFDLKANIDLKQNLNLYTTCKQLDSLNLILSVFDNSVQTNLTNYNVRLKAMKADKVPLVQEHTGISISGNVITIETDEQFTTTSGKTLIELQFIDEVTGKKKATFNLVLIVVSTTLEVERGISKATYTLLEELENKLDQASDFFENIEDAIVANNNLKKTISNSETAESNLETAITNANNKKNEVDEAITIATNKIEEVEQSIINANNSKTELDASKTIADTTKIDLDNANVQAEKNIEELNKLGDATDLAAKVQTNTENISKNTKSIESLDAQMNDLANEKGYAKVKIFNDPTDLNTMTESGIYASDKFTNTPNGNSTWRIVEVFNMTVTDTYAIQRCMGIANGGDKIYQRQCNNGTWTAWRELATTTPPTEYTITGLNGFATATGSKSVYFKTNDNVVTINCYLTASTPVTGTVILFNLPEGYRVKDGAAVRIISNLIRPIIIRADGTVQAICENTSEIYFNVSYKGV
ncbi:pyocin knob domain-containing protein [Clostridium butyricum]|uniref:pyocin knob domain-containing protein n=1 Tax=Clostridium butyricum TaxID=1492 RepID=UPI0011DDCFDA|nr:pyocin knob domain-containing protein [Clostridium butyricum]